MRLSVKNVAKSLGFAASDVWQGSKFGKFVRKVVLKGKARVLGLEIGAKRAEVKFKSAVKNTVSFLNKDLFERKSAIGVTESFVSRQRRAARSSAEYIDDVARRIYHRRSRGASAAGVVRKLLGSRIKSATTDFATPHLYHPTALVASSVALGLTFGVMSLGLGNRINTAYQASIFRGASRRDRRRGPTGDLVFALHRTR